jgi:hypothetical protein
MHTSNVRLGVRQQRAHALRAHADLWGKWPVWRRIMQLCAMRT